MKITFNKSLWKLLLLLGAVIIFSSSIIYTNHIVNTISKEEKMQVELWADAIKEKARLLKYTYDLFDKITVEEKKKAELWGKAIKEIEKTTDPNQDIGFVFEVIKNNETIPVILTDRNGQILSIKNIDTSITNHPELLQKELEEMKSLNKPIEVSVSGKTTNYLYFKDSKIFTAFKNAITNTLQSFITEDVIKSANLPVIYVANDQKTILAHNLDKRGIHYESEETYLQELKETSDPIKVEVATNRFNYIYYAESQLLTQLRYFPFIQFLIISIFLSIGYMVFSTGRKAEQNQVWVGMSKETAHQLGTPISSLMAWLELLKSQYEENETIVEIQRDISRLEMITERFSKIGSAPSLQQTNIVDEILFSIDYLKTRLSNYVKITLNAPDKDLYAMINTPLFSWVIENLCKNATDAMDGKGLIHFEISAKEKQLFIDISDTGKGISKSKQKTIFQPGFTTKSRGWGLGLTLVKRIVESYHGGKIFVKHSELDKGTTFRIVLNKIADAT